MVMKNVFRRLLALNPIHPQSLCEVRVERAERRNPDGSRLRMVKSSGALLLVEKARILRAAVFFTVGLATVTGLVSASPVEQGKLRMESIDFG